MASIFDGMGSIVAATFGACVSISRDGVPVEVTGIFRFVLVDDAMGDGRAINRQMPVLRLPANATAPLKRGDLVQPSELPGRTFKVLQPDTSGTATADELVTYVLEEVLT